MCVMISSQGERRLLLVAAMRLAHFLSPASGERTKVRGRSISTERFMGSLHPLLARIGTLNLPHVRFYNSAVHGEEANSDASSAPRSYSSRNGPLNVVEARRNNSSFFPRPSGIFSDAIPILSRLFSEHGSRQRGWAELCPRASRRQEYTARC